MRPYSLFRLFGVSKVRNYFGLETKKAVSTTAFFLLFQKMSLNYYFAIVFRYRFFGLYFIGFIT